MIWPLRSKGASRRTLGIRRRLALEILEPRDVFASLPFGATPLDTGEFMLGRVAVTPVLLESNGQLDTSTENWTSAHVQEVLQKIETGLQWWEDLLATKTSVHSLEFVIDPTYANNRLATKYEPISRISNDYALWVQEFLTTTGFAATGNIELDIRAFNHAQREKLDTDWSFTIFVVNSQIDPDGQFRSGGSFSRAFAFAGGLFQVIPSTRPASTFTHETGHMFWAKDEYSGGASYFERRGYYNTQNANAADNPTPGFVQQPSIMAAGTLLDTAYDTRVSPASTLEMIGWKDSDGDGIFDLMDVPLSLEGSGVFDTITNTYKFKGRVKVQALPNQNTEGLRNDITLNRISRIEYRLNGGAWQTHSQPNVYSAEVSLHIPVPAGNQTIEIRALDDRTQITSNTYLGRIGRADSTVVPGINGVVWIDANKNGLRDAGEMGESGWTIDVLSSSGQPLELRRNVEPDQLPDGPLASSFNPHVSLSSVGTDADGRVAVFVDTVNSTGNKNFRGYSRGAQSWMSTWNGNTRRFQMNFNSPTSVLELDAIGAGPDSFGRLEAYDAAGNLLFRYTTGSLASGSVETMTIRRPSADIAYAIAGGHNGSTIRLDNLRFGPTAQTVTGANGQFSVPSLPAGTYQVKMTPSSASYIAFQPSSAILPATVTAGQATVDIDFGARSSSSQWQNPQDRFDVNNNGSVSAIDVLLIVNEINQNGSRNLTEANLQAPPFIDVSGDGFVTALDALLVVNQINSRGNGEGEAAKAYQSQDAIGAPFSHEPVREVQVLPNITEVSAPVIETADGEEGVSVRFLRNSPVRRKPR